MRTSEILILIVILIFLICLQPDIKSECKSEIAHAILNVIEVILAFCDGEKKVVSSLK